MGRIGEKFAGLHQQGKAALIPFLMAGDPDLGATRTLALEVIRAGADLLELGVPFSDPMADGPTLQRAARRALRSGTTLPRVLEVVAEIRRESEVPLFLLGYYNPFFRYGLKEVARDARRAGVDGILCVDLPPEEAGEFKSETDREGLDLIFMLAPTSPPSRVRKVLGMSRGLVYFVSVTGTTGARASLPEDLRERVQGVRTLSSLPVAVGFGISTPEQAAWVASFADGVVVGSALAQMIENFQTGEGLASEVGGFVSRLSQAVKAGSLPLPGGLSWY